MRIQDLKRDVAEKVSEVTKVTHEMEVKDAQIRRYSEQVQSATQRVCDQIYAGRQVVLKILKYGH